MNTLTHTSYIPLPQRAVLRLGGEDARSFLQGLLTNNVDAVSKEQGMYALLLTPQGKFLYDLFLAETEDGIFVDVPADGLDTLLSLLKRYRLRSNVTIEDLSEQYDVVAIIGEDMLELEGITPERGFILPFCKGLCMVDPRNVAMGGRVIIERENAYQSLHAKGCEPADISVYHRHRISLGLPEAGIDIMNSEHFPLQFRMDQHHAIAFDKGCYVGQEVTARSKHRGAVRKLLYTVEGQGDLPEAGAVIEADGKKAGELRGSAGNLGLAILQVDAAEKPLTAGDISIQAKSAQDVSA